MNSLTFEAFTLHYQPQWDTRLQRLIGFEALIRSDRSDHMHVSPAQLIIEAEASGFIVDITELVLHTACKQVMGWQEDGVRTTLAMNISPIVLERCDFIAMVEHALGATGMPPSCIQLEITENAAAVIDMPSAVNQLQALKAMGVRIALDDFGTGYSSLSCLLTLPINQLKIDRTFVQGLEASESKRLIIIECIMNLAERLGLDVIVEGIESDEERMLLEGIGCTRFQGYLFGHPLPAEQAEKLLRTHAFAEEPQIS